MELPAPTTRDAKLDLSNLRAAGEAARAQMLTWPAWEREAVRAVSESAASREARAALRTLRG